MTYGHEDSQPYHGSPDFPTPPLPSIAMRTSTGVGPRVGVGGVATRRVPRLPFFSTVVGGEESESVVTFCRALCDPLRGSSRIALPLFLLDTTGVDGLMLDGFIAD
eukprot:scpid50786/ scgid23076/ 